MPTPLSPEPAFGSDQLLTLTEAARLVGVAPDALERHILDGPIEGRMVREAGGVVRTITRAELARHFPAEYPAPGVALDATAETQLRCARLEGELTSATKVENSLHNYIDRIEGRLGTARREALTLARALGQAEARLEAHSARRAQISPPARPATKRGGLWRRLIGRDRTN